jgi:hypothetical protein
VGFDRLSTASQDENTRAAKVLMQEGLIGCIEGAPPAWITSATEPPEITVPWLEDLLSKQDTYRAGALTIFCYAVGTNSLMDMRPFSDGVRGAGEFTKKLFRRLSPAADRRARDARSPLAATAGALRACIPLADDPDLAQ